MKKLISNSAAALTRARWTKPLNGLLMGLALMSVASGAHAATFLVTETQDNSAGGSLRAAINLANVSSGADQIIFLPGMSGTIALQRELPNFSTDISINGPAGGIIISGDSDGNGSADVPLFAVTSGAVNISNLTLAKGKGNDGAKGSFGQSGEIGWGAITMRSGTLNLSGCTLSGNVGGKGGDGGDNFGSGKTGAGALEIQGGVVSLTNCTVAGNTGGAGGKGASYGNGLPGSNGVGVINVNGGTLNVNQSTIASNAGGAGGQGGVNNVGVKFSYDGITNGGGISNGGSTTTTLNNSLVVDNAGGNIAGNAPTGSYNITSGTLANLEIGVLGNYGGPTQTMPLHTGSPALDAGDPNATGGFDQRGFARVQHGRMDIGAFESAPVPIDRAPTDIKLSSASIDENQNAGTRVGTLSTIDADSGDTFTYSLVGENNDNALFTIDGDGLKTTTPFDYETKNSYRIRVQTDDGRSGIFAKDFTITVSNVNEETPSLIVTTTDDSMAEDNLTSLREAIIIANRDADLSEITFAPGISGTIALQRELPNFSTDITIISPAAGIIISGDSDGDGNGSADVPLFTVASGTTNIINLTLAKGKGIEGAKGAPGMDGSLGTGAITTRGGTLNLSGCTLNGNVGGKGGDAGDFYNADLGRPKYGAGALEIRGGAVNLTNCTVVGNTGGAGGSGVHTLGGSASGANGVGTINVNGGVLSVNQSTIAGNAGGAGGPGSGNGRTDGGGISSGGSTTKLNNSLVVGNIGGNLAGNAPAGKYNITIGTLEDVKLGSLANNGGSTQTMALLEGSMAINAGDPGVTNGTDQRGEARVKRGRMDIGAYESDFMPVNQVPTDINLSDNSVEENKDAGTTVGTFSSVDFNGDDSFTYALVGESNDNSSFTVDGDVLKTAAKFNYKTKKSYLIRVQTDDGNGGTFAKDFTINVKQTPPLVVTTTNDIVADDDLTSLREAINFANSNPDLSEITFAPGISGTLALQSALPDLSTNIRIVGPTAGIVISGDKDGNGTPDVPLFNVTNYTTSLFNLTLAKGQGTEGAKGYPGFTGEPGTGAITVRGVLNLSGCTLTGNVGGRGGQGGEQPRYYTGGGSFPIGDVGSGGRGVGALEMIYGAVSLTNCTVTNNVGGSGGLPGFSNFGHASTGYGVAAINATGGTLSVNQTTIVGNSGGGGVITYGGGISNSGSTTTLNNSLVVDNYGGNIVGAEPNGGNNIIGGTRASIKLGPLANNGGPTQTMALLAGSPAINAGDAGVTGGTDQRGEARVKRGRMDIGAFESDIALNSAPFVNPIINSPSVPGPTDLIVTDPRGADADGDSLTYSFVYKINGKVIAGEADKPNRVDLSRYTVKAGDSFTATFVANDGKVNSAPVTLTRIIAAAPVANPFSGSAPAGIQTALGPITGTDADGLALRYVLLSQPANGNAYLAGSGNDVRLYYTSRASFDGVDTMQFQVVNSEGRRSAPATISVTVEGNHAPTASSGSASVMAGVRTEIPLAANDADGDALSYRIATQPTNGTAFLAGNPNGGVSLFYTGLKTYAGSDQVQFTVTDTAGAVSAPATIGIMVQGSAKPTADAANLSAVAGVRASVAIVGHDADGGALRYRITTQPAHGKAFLAGSGDNVRLYYTADAGYRGTDRAMFTVSDSTGRVSTPAPVNITVTAPGGGGSGGMS